MVAYDSCLPVLASNMCCSVAGAAVRYFDFGGCWSCFGCCSCWCFFVGFGNNSVVVAVTDSDNFGKEH